MKLEYYNYCTLAIITRGFYYFYIFSYVGFSLMFGGIPVKLCGYKTREVRLDWRAYGTYKKEITIMI